MHPKIKHMVRAMEVKQQACPKGSEQRWFLYMLRCRNDAFYTGVTKDLDRRLKMHNDGKASRYTRSRRPVALVYWESCDNRTHALVRECQVKALSRGKKEELIQNTRKKPRKKKGGRAMASLFSRIISGEVPCYKIYEDKNYLAFLDIRPIRTGHTLVVPKKEIDYLFDADDAMLGGIMVFAKNIARAIAKEVQCLRVGVMIAGLEVPHAHIHLVPILKVSDLNFANAKPATDEDLAAVASKIRRHFQ